MVKAERILIEHQVLGVSMSEIIIRDEITEMG